MNLKTCTISLSLERLAYRVQLTGEQGATSTTINGFPTTLTATSQTAISNVVNSTTASTASVEVMTTRQKNPPVTAHSTPMQPTSASTSRRNTLTAGSFTPEPLTRPAEESTAGSITGTTPSQNVNLTVTAVPGDEAGLSSESGPTFLGLVLGTASGAAILALLLALIIVFYIRRRRSRRQKEKASVTSWHDEGLRGDVISSPIDTVRYEATTPHRQGEVQDIIDHHFTRGCCPH